jgi:hypothetical protein
VGKLSAKMRRALYVEHLGLSEKDIIDPVALEG